MDAARTAMRADEYGGEPDSDRASISDAIDVARSEIAACRSVSTTTSTSEPTATSSVDPETTLPLETTPSTEGAELNPGRATPWWSAGAASAAR